MGASRLRVKGILLHIVTYTFPGVTSKFSHTWYKHRLGCERATVSTSCIWPRADTVTRRDENDGRNLSSRGSNITWMGVTARITRRSYTMRKRSTDKFPCLNNTNMYKFIIHKYFITWDNYRNGPTPCPESQLALTYINLTLHILLHEQQNSRCKDHTTFRKGTFITSDIFQMLIYSFIH